MPDPTIPELLRQGLIITLLGSTLVFAGLGLLWGVMEMLMRVLPAGVEMAGGGEKAALGVSPTEAASSQPDVTAERARVAAIVASMALAHTLPGQAAVDPSAAQAAAEGQDESWTHVHRDRSLQSWQPPRAGQH